MFAPSALESFLQCPFQFFGRRTLRLECAPARPEERLSFMVEGTIVHAVLAEQPRDPQSLAEIFDRVFHRVCDAEHIPPGYRTEACRQRLRTDIARFLGDRTWPGGYETRTEQQFQYALAAGIEIKGRIDRLEVAADGEAFVIDYKYSGAQNLKKNLNDENRLQPQLYVLAAERSFNLRAAGMFYCGLRGDVKWAGWNDQGIADGIPIPPGWIEQAIENTLRIVGEIRAGRLEPNPADPERCPRCECRDVCRFHTAAPALAEGA